MWYPHNSLLLFVLSCLFSYTIYKCIERHMSLQEYNSTAKAFFSFLPFLLHPLKIIIIIHKGSPFFLNANLGLLGLFVKDLVTSSLEIQENCFKYLAPAVTLGVCWGMTSLFPRNALPQAIVFGSVSADSISCCSFYQFLKSRGQIYWLEILQATQTSENLTLNLPVHIFLLM